MTLVRPGTAAAPHTVYRGGGPEPYWVAFTPDGTSVLFAGGLGESGPW